MPNTFGRSRRGAGVKAPPFRPIIVEESESSDYTDDTDDEDLYRPKPWRDVKHDPKLVKEEGVYLHKIGHLKEAIKRYNKVLEDDPSDVTSLLARSRVHMDNGDLEQAMKDADAAVNGFKRAKKDPLQQKGNFGEKDWTTTYQKAEALFSLGHFEEALVLYYRGTRSRPNLPQFRLGIAKCKEAINNTVLSEAPNKKKHSRSSSVASLPSLSTTPLPSWKTGNLSQLDLASPRRKKLSSIPEIVRSDAKHVRKLNGSTRYLTELLSELDQDSKLGKEIRKITNESLNYVKTRNTYWKQQLPPQVASKLDKMAENDMNGRKEDEVTLFAYIMNEMKRINRDFAHQRYEDCIAMAQKCMNALEMYTEEEIASKQESEENQGTSKKEMQGKLHSYLGSSYMELGQLKDALNNHKQDYSIAKHVDNHKAEARALENIGKVYSKMGKYDDAISVWEKKIDLCENNAERCWLFQEMGYCYMHKKDGYNAATYGQKAYDAASADGDYRSQLTACTLIAQAEVMQGNLDDGHDKFKQALDLANMLDDENAASTINSAMQDINKAVVSRMKSQQAYSGLSTNTDVTLNISPGTEVDERSDDSRQIDSQQDNLSSNTEVDEQLPEVPKSQQSVVDDNRSDSGIGTQTEESVISRVKKEGNKVKNVYHGKGSVQKSEDNTHNPNGRNLSQTSSRLSNEKPKANHKYNAGTKSTNPYRQPVPKINKVKKDTSGGYKFERKHQAPNTLSQIKEDKEQSRDCIIDDLTTVNNIGDLQGNQVGRNKKEKSFRLQNQRTDNQLEVLSDELEPDQQSLALTVDSAKSRGGTQSSSKNKKY